jgi:hypothetical protein
MRVIAAALLLALLAPAAFAQRVAHPSKTELANLQKAEQAADAFAHKLHDTLDVGQALQGLLRDDMAERARFLPDDIDPSQSLPPRLLALQHLDGDYAKVVGEERLERFSMLEWDLIFLNVAAGVDCDHAPNPPAFCDALNHVDDPVKDMPGKRIKDDATFDQTVARLAQVVELQRAYVREHGMQHYDDVAAKLSALQRKDGQVSYVARPATATHPPSPVIYVVYKDIFGILFTEKNGQFKVWMLGIPFSD